ncbi:hypothetical protein QCA50_012935 [Cerrena zonata]|uniref:Uncharacterized protein n=1 Tax=Cerrena zonata TaxID=2478898 RepID=A0AAW0FXZ3_9APHY
MISGTKDVLTKLHKEVTDFNTTYENVEIDSNETPYQTNTLRIAFHHAMKKVVNPQTLSVVCMALFELFLRMDGILSSNIRIAVEEVLVEFQYAKNIRDNKLNFIRKFECASLGFQFIGKKKFPETEKECMELFNLHFGDPVLGLLEVAGFKLEPLLESTRNAELGDSKFEARPDLIYSQIKNFRFPKVGESDDFLHLIGDTKNLEIKSFIEFKGPELENCVEGNQVKENNGGFKSIIRQVTKYLLACKTPRAIISNFMTTIFLEIDEEKLEKLFNNGKPVIPEPGKEMTLPFQYKSSFIVALFGSFRKT